MTNFINLNKNSTNILKNNLITHGGWFLGIFVVCFSCNNIILNSDQMNHEQAIIHLRIIL